MSGTVYLVGAGPGATDLLTLRAARLLESADMVFHDALVPNETLALAKRAQLVAVGKRCGRHATAQRFINKRLIDAARRYATVVRLKGGDPLLFGRAQEEVAALEAAGVAYEVVPGVTAALAAAAAIGTSLSQRGTVRSIALATPRVGNGEHASDWVRAFIAADAGAIYMGIGEAPAIAVALLANGKSRSLPVAVVDYTTLVQLPTLALHEFTGPTLLLVGPQFGARATLLQSAEADRCRPSKAAREKHG